VPLCDGEAVPPPRSLPGHGPCPSAAGARRRAEFQPDRFQKLSSDGRRLIIGWSRRAEHALARGAAGDGDGQSSSRRSQHTFEAFIYAWISFNGWASCCTDNDKDSAIIDVLREDERLSTRFDSLVQTDSTVAAAVERFRALWPIFRASHVRAGADAAAREYRRSGRAGLVAYYSDTFPGAARAPDCHPRHDCQAVQADWAHTLEALYRVRCNLFHGTKSVDGEIDREVVDAASAVLGPVVNNLVRHQFT
jgi:hypothetical protein